MDYSWFSVVICNLLLTGKSTLSANVDVQPSPIATITEGAVLWLTCRYDLDGGTLGQLQWTANDGGTAATAAPAATPPCSTLSPDNYSVDCNLASNEVRLGILNPVHGGTYSCSVYLSDFTLIGPVSTQVSVVVPVTSVTFTFPVNDTVTVTPGGSQVYLCVTGSCRPPAWIEWYKDGVNVTTQTGSVSSDGDKFVTTSSFILTGVKGDSPATIQCRALNMDGMTPVQSGVKTFIVEYPPTGNLIVTPSGTQSILTGTLVTFQCHLRGGYPLATLTWQCKGTPEIGQNLTNSTTAVSSLTVTVDRTYHQEQCMCIAGYKSSPNGVFGTVSVGFNITYPPTELLSMSPSDVQIIKTGSTVTLRCQLSGGNPLAILTWQCKGLPVSGNDLSNTTTVVSTITVDVDMTFDQQQCSCTARHQASPNGVFDTEFVMFHITDVPDIVISPLDNPYIIKENQTNVTLTCAVTSTIPPVTSILWRKESVLVSSTGIYSIPVVNRDTSGVYTCYATNDAGTSTANITLQVLLIPLVPHLLGITDVTSSSISIKLAVYDPNSLAINITYTCFGCVAKKWMYVDLTDVQDTYVTTLTNLLPNTQYNLAVTAESTAGSSNQLRIIVATSSANEFSSPPSYTSTAPSTALIVVAVACIIVGLIACGTGAILYRKARVTGRSGDRQNQLAKPEIFSDVMATGSDRDMENHQDSSHYQELQQYDIGKPSIYDHITQADNSGTLGMERDGNDSQQQPSDHDYSNAT